MITGQKTGDGLEAIAGSKSGLAIGVLAACAVAVYVLVNFV